MKHFTLSDEVCRLLNIGRKQIPELSEENIKKVDDYVKNDSSYAPSLSDNFAKKYFSENRNDDLSTIVTRVIIIDTIDSTNLKRLLGKDYFVTMAKRIKEANLEETIAKGGKIGKKFEQIARVPVNKNRSKSGYINLFIFLSKYISRTNEWCYGRNDYSIMDNVVKDFLPLYNTPSRGISAKVLESFRSNYDYDGYCDAIGKVLLEFPNVTREMLDHFIWFTFKKSAANDK